MSLTENTLAGSDAVDGDRAQAGTPRWLRSTAYWAYQYKRTWRGSLTTSFLYPILYLTAMGVGLGSLINHHVHQVGGVPYLHFVAPGLLAATAMQVGTNESMYPVMGAIKWLKTYYAMLATPLDVLDVLIGHLAWIAVRLATVSVIYVAIMAAFGTIHSYLAILAIPVAIATGMAFSAPMTAFAASQQNDTGFATIYRLLIIPMFLFSGTFFPISQLPGWLQIVARVTPLYHGVALCRGLTLGHLALWPSLAHVGYLVGLAAIGVRLGMWSYKKRLVI